MATAVNPIPVIIDTDIGDDIDDILALSFALLRPELQVVGITTCFGGVATRARMVSKLLRIMGRTDVVVAAGRSLPLNEELANRQRAANTPWQGAFAQDEPDRDWPDAVQFIVDAVQRQPGEIGLITLGPLTNIGAALRLAPNLGRQVRFIASMAASIERATPEYNAGTDPEATQLVLNSGAPLFIGTWETTRRVTLLPAVEALFRDSDSSLGQALWQNIELWRPVQGTKPGPVMYDLAPIVWAIWPDLYPTKQVFMQMSLTGPTRGRTNIAAGKPNVALCVDAKAEEVETLYLSTVLGVRRQ